MIEIPPDVVKREAESVTAQYARVARIPGFRPGHAPRTLVQRRFRDEIKNEVVQTLVPRFFENAVKDQNLSVVGRPRFEDLKFEAEDQPLTVKATFETYPEFALKEYKGLEAEEEPPTVTDADVDRALEELRQAAATFEVVSDRPAVEGDYLLVKYQGWDAADSKLTVIEPREGMVHLGGKETVSGFTEHLVGSRPGEDREFEVEYPEEFPGPTLAGKTVRYRAEVQDIKKKVAPPVDDELAKTVSEFGTLAELRAQLQKNLEARRQHDVENATRRKLVESLIEAHQFPVPEALVEERLEQRFEGALAQLRAQGIDPSTAPLDWRRLREDMRPEAEKAVRSSVILEKIADAEQIEVSDEEVDELIREMAQEARETPAALKTRLTQKEKIDKVKSSRRNQKALDFIYRNAKIIRKSA